MTALLDTSVIVRYLTGEPRRLAEKARLHPARLRPGIAYFKMTKDEWEAEKAAAKSL